MSASSKLSRRKVLTAAAASALSPSVLTARAADERAAQENTPAPPAAVFLRHDPVGRGIGVMPGRVVWAHDPQSVSWDGTGYWWQLEHFDGVRIRRMLDRSIVALAGLDPQKAADAAVLEDAWRRLFENFNERTTGRKEGHAPGDRIAVKVNMNGAGAYGSRATGFTQESYGNAVLMRALLTSLVEGAGIDAGDIVFYDAGRVFPQYLMDYVRTGSKPHSVHGAQPHYPQVAFRHRAPGTELDAVPDKSSSILWSGDIRGDVCYVPKCVAQSRYLINLANLKGHCYGLTLCGKNHFGSFVNTDRMRAPQAAGLHGNIAGARPGDYSVLVDLMGHHALGAKTMLCLLDGLLTAVGESVSLTAEDARWSMPPFDGGFCASLFASQDPVAIDSVGADFLMNESNMTRRNSALAGNVGVENYLHEAAEADRPQSGTHYTDGASHALKSLGVHEHWDNVRDKRYSRNRGKPEGIELVAV